MSSQGKSGSAQSFRDLLVWQKAHEFVLTVYKMTEQFPESEKYGLTSQIRRSAISIPANIAEGFKKQGKLDKIRFYNISQGSLEECKYYLILAHDLQYFDTTESKEALDEIGRLLSGLIRSIRHRTP
ncbi:MAG: four helix bundle protein [Lentisphaeria bacterium]|nr:four helix bundle protein [Candidatus Neomarinimicrobiota bacterium]MCF7843148.1 four helix bundle protein [Lentisphaeria bacterium]